MAIKGLILDVDGTLVDSNAFHARAWQQAMAEAGFIVGLEQIKTLIGMKGSLLLPKAVGVEADSDTGKRVDARRAELFKKRYLPQVRAFPRTEELLARLHDDGVQMVVASSSEDEVLEPLLKRAGAKSLVEGKTSAEDAEHSKPAPDIVEAALEKFDIPRAEILMLGDTPYDVEAANRAGVGCVALRCGGWDDASLSEAVAIYDSPADLLEHLDTSPLAQNNGAEERTTRANRRSLT